MLGSMSEADDAVQEAWIRLNRADTTDVDNLRGWLTTVVARVCLDMLRSRKSRREEPLEPVERTLGTRTDPEREAILTDSVGLALLVVLDALDPAERVAFVLHDMFAVPFEEIAAIVGRSPMAARQLASRARRKVRGAGPVSDVERPRHRELVDAFLTALRAGDFEALIAVLDPNVVVRADRTAPGAPAEIRGAREWARGAVAFGHMARHVRPALVDGSVGLIMAPQGRLTRALRFSIAGDRIVGVDVISDPASLRRLEVGVLDH
jgi:RNA polymerase sigma-70 factor (ECF subfamily)